MNNSLEFFDRFIFILSDVQRDTTVFWILVKYCFVLAFFLYFLFALLVLRQTFLMAQTFKTTAEPVLKIFAFIHLLFALGLVVLALVVL